MNSSVPNLSLPLPYQVWSEDQVWQVFTKLCSNDVPLSGVSERLDEYRAIFSDVYKGMLYEHAAVLGTHFRSPDGAPFVNPLNLEHLTRLLHLFAHQIFLAGGDIVLLDALFFVLKSRCQINLFYKQKIDRFFFAFHALGAVLGYGDYGSFLVVTQGSTIGQNHNRYPSIGNCVVIGPGAAVLGRCNIGDNVLVGAGALLIDQDVPANTTVTGRPPNLVMRDNSGDNRSFNFDMRSLAEMGEL